MRIVAAAPFFAATPMVIFCFFLTMLLITDCSKIINLDRGGAAFDKVAPL